MYGLKLSASVLILRRDRAVLGSGILKVGHEERDGRDELILNISKQMRRMKAIEDNQNTQQVENSFLKK